MVAVPMPGGVRRYRTVRAWPGWQLLTDEQVAAGEDGQTRCTQCGDVFEQLLAETLCAICMARV